MKPPVKETVIAKNKEVHIMKIALIISVVIGCVLPASAGLFESCVDQGDQTGPVNGGCAVVEGVCYGHTTYYVTTGVMACEPAASYCGGTSYSKQYEYDGTCGGANCSPVYGSPTITAVPNPCG